MKIKAGDIVVARSRNKDKFLGTYIKKLEEDQHLVRHYNKDIDIVVDEVAIPNSVLSIGIKHRNNLL